jgi:hypothetical protein
MGRRGREMMRIGRCRNGGGRVGGEGWIDGKCIREDDNGGLVCLCMDKGLLKAFDGGLCGGDFML